MMDFRTPCQILLGLLLAALSISVLGLAADNVSFVHKNASPSPVPIHYTRWNETAQAQYSYWVTIDYTPSRFSLSTTNAMIAASVVCGIVGAGIAIGSWMMRGTKVLQTGFTSRKENERSAPFLPIALIFTAVAFVLSLAIAIYVWQPTMQWPIKFRNSLPFPSNITKKDSNGPITYQSPFDYTPEVWNCLLAPYVVDLSQSHKMSSLCREAGVARYLMLPVLVCSAALLFCLFWTWRQARTAATAEADNANVKEVEEVSVGGKE